jgi:hypothetical protein
MHRYSTPGHIHQYVYPALFFVAYLIYFAAHNFLGAVGQNITPFVVFSLFGALVWVFENFAWRLLCRIRQLKIADFSGVYEGEIVAGDERKRSTATITITQTWTTIKVAFKSGDASSRSISAGVLFDRLGFDEIELAYNYFGQGGDVPAHYGTAMVRLQPDRGLDGAYFTEQKRDSFGSIAVRRV